MMAWLPSIDRERRRRIVTAAGVVGLHAALIGALVAVRFPVAMRPAGSALILFDVAPPPPAPVPPPPAVVAQRAPRAEGAAAPPNRHARPKPVTAPPAPALVAPPVVAAPVASTGPDASAGAAELPGPGTGAGGQGTGLGSGAGGAGTGGGGGGTRARRIKGGINIADYPRAAGQATGTVIVTLDIGTDGRVTGCRVARSSGNAALDHTTCRLATERFRYRPATDARGRAVADVAGWRQDWWLEPPD